MILLDYYLVTGNNTSLTVVHHHRPFPSFHASINIYAYSTRTVLQQYTSAVHSVYVSRQPVLQHHLSFIQSTLLSHWVRQACNANLTANFDHATLILHNVSSSTYPFAEYEPYYNLQLATNCFQRCITKRLVYILWVFLAFTHKNCRVAKGEYLC